MAARTTTHKMTNELFARTELESQRGCGTTPLWVVESINLSAFITGRGNFQQVCH
jgi:hypothetical protein